MNMKIKNSIIIAFTLVAVSICFACSRSAGKINPHVINSSRIKSSSYDTLSSGSIITQNVNSSSQTTNDSSSSSATTSQPTYSISFINFITSKLGYVCLNISTNINDKSYNLLFKTSDGGKDWGEDGNNKALCYTSFVNEEVGYGLFSSELADNCYCSYSEGDNNTLVKTTNGGLSWTPVSYFDGKGVAKIDVLNSHVIFVGTITYLYGGDTPDLQIYESVDGGSTWKQIRTLKQINPPSDDTLQLQDFSWISSQEGYALYQNNFKFCQDSVFFRKKEVYRTTNGGESWSLKSESATLLGAGSISNSSVIGNLPVSGYCWGFSFFNNGLGYLTHYTPDGIYYMKSVDGGRNFSNVNFFRLTDSRSQNNLTPCFINKNDAFAVFNDGSLNYTTNGGEDWSQITSSDYWKTILEK
jgi:photosystem II stability/assembly factor-like uncharacterized protein